MAVVTFSPQTDMIREVLKEKFGTSFFFPLPPSRSKTIRIHPSSSNTNQLELTHRILSQGCTERANERDQVFDCHRGCSSRNEKGGSVSEGGEYRGEMSGKGWVSRNSTGIMCLSRSDSDRTVFSARRPFYWLV